MQTNKDPVVLAEIANDKAEPKSYEFRKQVLCNEIIELVSDGGDFDDINLDSVIDSVDNAHVSSLIDFGIDVKAKFISKSLDPMSNWLITKKLREIVSDYVDEHDFLLTDGVIH